MCRYAWKNYKEHYACFRCRKMFRQIPVGELPASLRSADNKRAGDVKCPECKQPMHDMGLDFKAPRQNDLKQWRKVEILYTHGFTWHGCGCGGNGPAVKTLHEVGPFIARMRQRRQAAENASREAAKRERRPTTNVKATTM